jgi:two-component system chemotaxis sensor kinase CheA
LSDTTHRVDPAGEKAREEFFSEAQELVDGLGRDLLALDEVVRRGGSDPELINDVFRAVHTLKGISGLFGAARMTGLSHELEDVLDDLRLGRVELTPEILDLLFRAVELYGRILAAEKGDSPDPADGVEALLFALAQHSAHRGGGGASLVAQFDLDPGLLGVLTEYEEHRLRANVQGGQNLYRLRVRFPLATIDTALDELKASARPYGEIITYLPTGGGTDLETIELEILMASPHGLAVLDGAIAGPNVAIEAVERRGRASVLPFDPSADEPPGLRMASSGDPSAEELASASADPFATRNRAVSPAQTVPPPAEDRSQRTPSPLGVRARGASEKPVVAAPAAASHPPTPAGKSQEGSRELSLRSVSQTVRVDIRKLDTLMTVVGELAIVRTALHRVSERVKGERGSRELLAELARLHRSFERQLAQMQAGILEVRMVPLGQVFDKLSRVVRQISREHDKQVNLVITGAETEIDKLIVEELSDPLMHMIRNAIDHGIESRDDRVRMGKPPVGTIVLNAFQKGNQVVISVEDDGRGMDPGALLKAAIRRRVVTEDEAKALSLREIFSLVFMPGFTTKTVATEVSGRGVGLDVVKTNIGKLGGIVDVTSEVTIGTKMTVTLPVTLAIISVLTVDIADRHFAIPLASIKEAIPLREADVRTVDGREMITVRGASVPICRLGTLFELESSDGARSSGVKRFAVLTEVGNRSLGLVVDRLVGQQDIVIKSLGKSLSSVRGIAGATELGDQRVALVLDVAALVEEVLLHDDKRFAVSPPVKAELVGGRR